MTTEAPEPTPDAVLVAGAQRGQRDAREELARRYRRPAFLFAYQLLGNREDASDVAQDALLKFFTTLERFESHRPVQPWLFRIVRNRVVDVTAALRNIVGGEVSEYTKLSAESREQALDRMVAEAKSLGANAVVEVRFSTSMVMAAAAELLAYGTAVVVEDS